VVYLIHASDGCLPSDMAAGSEAEIEEELRLAYVAMTRARDFLYISWPLRYYFRKHKTGDGYGFAQLSRFFNPAVCETLEQDLSMDDPPGFDDSTGDDGEFPRMDIKGSLRDMWR
jgi:DNA helicase II / ATP-dependent DNA helicase PcrA